MSIDPLGPLNEPPRPIPSVASSAASNPHRPAPKSRARGQRPKKTNSGNHQKTNAPKKKCSPPGLQPSPPPSVPIVANPSPSAQTISPLQAIEKLASIIIGVPLCILFILPRFLFATALFYVPVSIFIGIPTAFVVCALENPFIDGKPPAWLCNLNFAIITVPSLLVSMRLAFEHVEEHV